MEALVREWLEPDISLEEEVERNWAEVIHQTYRFDYLSKQVCVITFPESEFSVCSNSQWPAGEHVMVVVDATAV